MATSIPQPQSTHPTPPPLTPEQIAVKKAQEQQMKTMIAAIIAIVVFVLAGLITAIYFLSRPETPPEQVGRIRDIFIIVVALETLLIGIALVVLLVQLASLINLLQNEVRPILQAATDTINTLRGTAEFLGESVIEPVIKLNSYLASIQRVLELMGLKRK